MGLCAPFKSRLRARCEAAYAWLCQRRKDAGPHHDVWRVRERWETLRGSILKRLRAGLYRLSPVSMADGRDGKRFECWEGEDAVVLKMLSSSLEPVLTARLSEHCHHLPGRGGCKGAVVAVREALATGRYPFVLRSDARGYYANIRHTQLLEQLRRHVDDPVILDLVSQYCERTTVHRGHYKRAERGIPLGCSLSPLMGALYLDPLDRALENLPGVRYVRFMDDWIVLAESRWKLRRAVKVMNAVLAELHLEQHPDKTFIGRVERGFDFLGFDFSPAGVTGSSERSEARYTENISRLYEQGASEERVERYRQNWLRWRRGILGAKRPANPPEGPPTLPVPSEVHAYGSVPVSPYILRIHTNRMRLATHQPQKNLNNENTKQEQKYNNQPISTSRSIIMCGRLCGRH
jgi:RNA-directed DNA polymerase